MAHFTRCPALRRGARGWHTAQCPLVTVSTHPSRRPSRPSRHWARTAAVVDSSNLVLECRDTDDLHSRQLTAYTDRRYHRRAAWCTVEILHIFLYIDTRQRYGQPTVSLHVKLYRPHIHAPPPPATWWAASALVRRMHTTSERATSDKNYATYPRPHRAPAARPRERPGATAHKGHKRPREEATAALPNVLRRPARASALGRWGAYACARRSALRV
mmetsp:Transcript_10205/g.33608  ORF Transcript_10205/g.33608 Transcript_10205/m.33608 type:complete len:216 (+) Transcript_10205:732-1379(+)